MQIVRRWQSHRVTEFSKPTGVSSPKQPLSNFREYLALSSMTAPDDFIFCVFKNVKGLGLKQIHHTSHQVIPSLTTWNDPCWPSSIPTSRQQSHSDRQQVPGNFKAYQTTWSCHENPKASGNHDHDIECYYCYSLLYDSYMTFNAVIWRRVMSHGMSQETSRWSIAAERTCDLRVVAAWRNSGIGRFASGGLMPLKPFVFFLLPGIMLRCNDVIWCNDVNCELKSVMSSCHPLGIETQTNCSLEFHFIMASRNTFPEWALHRGHFWKYWLTYFDLTWRITVHGTLKRGSSLGCSVWLHSA